MFDGTLIFNDNGMLSRPISKVTGSSLTHVAIIFNDTVYESTWPEVHRIPFNSYLQLRNKGTYSYFQPRVPFTNRQIQAMIKYAVSQLGRPYAMREYWRNKDVRGIDCSQYIGNVLEKSGLIVSADFKESPGSLFFKIRPHYTFYILL